jgi:hypothetical protein
VTDRQSARIFCGRGSLLFPSRFLEFDRIEKEKVDLKINADKIDGFFRRELHHLSPIGIALPQTKRGYQNNNASCDCSFHFLTDSSYTIATN